MPMSMTSKPIHCRVLAKIFAMVLPDTRESRPSTTVPFPTHLPKAEAYSTTSFGVMLSPIVALIPDIDSISIIAPD